MITKELTLYKIKEVAVNSHRAVYNTAQLSSLIGKDFNTASVYLTRLWKIGVAKRLLRGKISFIDNDFVIASQLIEPSYISLSSALLFHNVSQQVPHRIQSVTPVNSITYDNLGLEYHRIPPPGSCLAMNATPLEKVIALLLQWRRHCLMDITLIISHRKTLKHISITGNSVNLSHTWRNFLEREN